MYVDEDTVQTALNRTGFGKFNIRVLLLSMLIYLNCGNFIAGVGFIPPAAICDFQMTTVEKGRITSAPMLGMAIGATFWGFFADLRGRRPALLLSLCTGFLFEILSALVSNYWIFVVLKFFTGVSITGQICVIFTFLGEFQPEKQRNKMLSWMEFAWVVGVLVAALLAWGVIPLPISFKLSYWFFGSWKLFVVIGTLPAFFSALYILTIPETPKYLAENGKSVKLLSVLYMIYHENTGNSYDSFKAELLSIGSPAIQDLFAEEKISKLCNPKEERKMKQQARKEKMKNLLHTSKKQMHTLVKAPYAKRLFSVSCIMFCITSTYYALMTWFPELFQRSADYTNFHNGQTESFCKVSSWFSQVAGNKTVVNQTDFSNDIHEDFSVTECKSEIDTSVYLNTVILAVASLPCAVIIPPTIDYVGYRLYLFITAFIACITTVAMYFVSDTTETLFLSGIFESLNAMNISLIYCFIVELFPTNLRVTATGITQFIGRVGSFTGNVLFGFLIDNFCTSLFIIMSIQLLIATLMTWMTPGNKKMKKIQQLENKGNIAPIV
ncbi:hypothetical protein TKK_0011849 [Trichogramma kaykai]|uniref:Major facilitator superfamily (MFS) profile domain-containing protein n=1 Tax=Trichogramma kaykai TaxID=54128 RepID=A0ABD2WQ38_9HYME